MRTVTYLLLVLGLPSCTKEKFSADEMEGYYRQIYVLETTPSGEVLYEDSTRNATHLELREDGGFYYNYTNGSWSVKQRTLRLSVNPGLLPEIWEYEMERTGEDLLQLRRTYSRKSNSAGSTRNDSREIVRTELFRKEG